MKKSSVYTRTGDTGTTGLVGGTRIKKSDPRIHLYGEVDELNSCIGTAISLMPKNSNLDYLQLVQNYLFDIGSNLACEKEKREQFKLPKISEEMITEVEKKIDELDEKLVSLKYFILPGGHPSAAFFHIVRTVCRRVERQMVDFEDQNPGEVPLNAIKFINRLSDYFFTLSRYINHQENVLEKSWIPKSH